MRRLVMVLMALMFLSGCARQETAPPLVAVLLTDDVRMPKVEGLKSGLAELGYPAGKIRVTVFSAKGDRSLLPKLAAEAIAAGPAVLVAGGGIEAVTIKGVPGPHPPVVMMGVASSVASGLVDSMIRPGGSVTGLDNQHAELSAKRLELLTKLVPGVRRVILLYDPQVVPGRHALAVTVEAARKLGVTVQALPTERLETALQGLQSIRPGDFDAALLLPGYVLESGARQIAREFERLRLPVMGPLDLEGEAGLLAAYGVSLGDQGLQSARFVDKLLRGENAAHIPVETPDNPVLMVDLRVARRLGIELAPAGLAFARTIGEKAGERP